MRKEKILSYLNSDEYYPVGREALAAALGVKEKALPQFFRALEELCANGDIIKGKRERIFSSEKLGLIKGVFKGTSKGFGFVNDDNGGIYISEEEQHGALDADTVLVRIVKNASSQEGAKNREGTIIKVISRGKSSFVGTFIQERGYGLFNPDNTHLPQMTVEQRFSHGALNGQKVASVFYEYDEIENRHYVKITEVLGFPDDYGVDVLSSIREHGFDTDFPQKVTGQANACNKVSAEETVGRLDLTKECIITIDGADTKDIDDAVCVKRKKDGYVLGVHIADVSHYVKPGTPLDKEAYSRGTSVYPVDRVVPMLPPVLSNGLCSLNEGEIRLAMSVIMEIDDSGIIKKSSFHKSVIKSKKRMTYDEVYQIIANGAESAGYKENGRIPKMLKVMYELSEKLKKRTHERGATEFEFPEAKAVLDGNGHVKDIVLRKTTFANEIIEEFMVAANSSVAEFLEKNDAGALYRVHDNPNEEKIALVRKFMINSGLPRKNTPSEMLEAARSTPMEGALSVMLLRSMAKACYSSENKGHYGLALENYCHFTSPIRRYPDLVCHRALKAILEDDKKAMRALKGFVKEAAEKCSERENAATLCERDTLDMKKAEYMQQFAGSEFTGQVSAVTGFGFFVMLPNTVEGLVRLESLRDDYYLFDEESLTLTGHRYGRVFSLGDTVRVRLISSDKKTRRIDFELLEGGKKNAGKPKKKNHRTKQNGASRVFHRRKGRGRH